MDKSTVVGCRLHGRVVDETLVDDSCTDVAACTRNMKDLVNVTGAGIVWGEVEGLRSGEFGRVDENAV